MPLPDIFSQKVTDEIIDRINHLTPTTQPAWGKMTVAQMLAHCNVTYEMVYEDKHPKPNVFMKWILTRFIKDKVVGETPYARNSRTAPAFLIKEDKSFEAEKSRLIGYIRKTQQLGGGNFNNKPSHSFGALSEVEWNNMFYKHLNHHLSQFGV